jgi:hypothetical protein
MAYQLVTANLTVLFHHGSPFGTAKVVTNNVRHLSWRVLCKFAGILICGVIVHSASLF